MIHAELWDSRFCDDAVSRLLSQGFAGAFSRPAGERPLLGPDACSHEWWGHCPYPSGFASRLGACAR